MEVSFHSPSLTGLVWSMSMKFSVIVVCLNPGTKLKTTMDSILGQTCRDFEVIIKDGGSTDGSIDPWKDYVKGMEGTTPKGRIVERSALSREETLLRLEKHSGDMPSEERIAAAEGTVRFFREKDRGIYDAMNQAVLHAAGEFILFLNCGDRFIDERVLERTADVIDDQMKAGADCESLVLYGDTYSEKNDVTIPSPPTITGFTCYRNIPCHQSCFYSISLCREKPYDQEFKVRADYDHFLWCFYRAKAKFVHMGFPVASYEGGGYSESRENRTLDRQEHRLITQNYMGKAELFRYRAIMACTLAPLRTAMAESRFFSGVYQWVKTKVYRR